LKKNVQFIFFVLFALLVGCASGPEVKKDLLPVFYPPLPSPPRIQYLTTYSSASDVGYGKRSAFETFVAGKSPEGDLSVKMPYGVAFHEKKIYVTDIGGGGYSIFDLEKEEYKFIAGSGPGVMERPANIVFDSSGIKFVADTGRKQVLVFDNEDLFSKAYGVEGEFSPTDVVVAENRLYVTDLSHRNIHVLDKDTGKTISTFKKEDILLWPTNMALGPDNILTVTDTGTFRLLQFSLDGKFIRTLGQWGKAGGTFSRPKGLDIDRNGNIYVVDAAFENVQLLDKDGRFLLFFGKPGAAPENINMPTGIAIDYESAPFFQKFAAPGFQLEYVIAVTSQFGRSKVNIFGYGKMDGLDYDAPVEAANSSEAEATTPSTAPQIKDQ